MLALIPLLPPVEIWVSPSGSDMQSGRRGTPVRTIERALERLGPQSFSRRVIHLGRGDYPVFKSIRLGPQDGNITIDGGGRARLLGGIPLKGWKRIADPATLARLSPEARKKVVEFKLPPDFEVGAMTPRGFAITDETYPTELFSGRQPLQLARFPNSGWLRTTASKGPRSFAFADPKPSGWQDRSNVWAVGYWSNEWSMALAQVAFNSTLDEAELAVKLPYGTAKGRRFYFLNVLEELDRPGEYFIDRVKGRAYLWPLERKSPIVASVAKEPLIDVKGASDVLVRGVDLEVGRDSGISVEESRNVRIESCRIRNFSRYGARFFQSKDSGLARCRVSGTGSAAVLLYGGDRKTLTPANLYADDCDLSQFARWSRTYQPGVALQGVGNRVSHCSIHDAPHSAVLFMGNDHILEFNDVRRVCQEVGDAGAFYTGRDVTQRGTIIRYNHFRDIAPTQSGPGVVNEISSVYLDDLYAGTTVLGNLFEGAGIGILLGGGRDNVIERNIFIGKTPAIHFDARGKGWAAGILARDNVIYKSIAEVNADQPPYSLRYPRLASVLTDDLGIPSGNRVANNVVYGRWIGYLDGLGDRDLQMEANSVHPFAEGLKFRWDVLGKVGPRKAPPPN